MSKQSFRVTVVGEQLDDKFIERLRAFVEHEAPERFVEVRRVVLSK